MPPSLYLALSYLKPKRSILSVINVLAVLGTMLGVAVLIIVISVMTGFGTMWREKILSFHPHVTLFSRTVVLDEFDPLFEDVAAHPEVVSVSPFIQTKVVLQYRDRMVLPSLRGIDPERDYLYQRLVREDAAARAAGRPPVLYDGDFSLGDEECLVGLELARTLGIRAGDTVSVISPTMFAREGEVRLPVDLRVAGIFSVGMFQVDDEFVLTDLQTARDVLGTDDGVDGMQIIGRDILRAEHLAVELREMTRHRFETLSWMRMNQTLFNALAVEKNMMFFLLAVISVVASFLIVCTLIMMSVQKTREIGLLKSMGFRNGAVMGAFMWYGLIQGFFGILWGTGLGFLVLRYRQNLVEAVSRITQTDLLPFDLYFLHELPAETRWEDMALIVGLVLSLSLLGGSIPAWLSARRNPVEALRHDG